MTRLSLTAAAFLAMCSPAHAQQLPPCGPFPIHIEAWSALYGEAPVAQGISNGGNVMLLMQNPNTGGWTVFHISPELIACAVDFGVALEVLPATAPGEPS